MHLFLHQLKTVLLEMISFKSDALKMRLTFHLIKIRHEIIQHEMESLSIK